MSIDLSLKPGWAHYRDGKLIGLGTLFLGAETRDFGTYPHSFIRCAEYVIERLFTEVINPAGAQQIVVEESNPGREVYSQKKLEFLHYALIKSAHLREIPVVYIRTGEWRRLVEARQNAEEKRVNGKIYRSKQKRNAAIDADSSLSDEQKKKLKAAPIKIDGKVAGRRGRKHVSVRLANELFGLQLKLKDEDAADAALLGLSWCRGAAQCDGTIKGGITPKVASNA